MGADEHRTVEQLEGCVTTEARADDVEPFDPTDLKADWTDDLPD